MRQDEEQEAVTATSCTETLLVYLQYSSMSNQGYAYPSLQNTNRIF